ncbi:MAG: hypothetical protein AABX10_02095 [Nanoarchaeota archaeon]
MTEQTTPGKIQRTRNWVKGHLKTAATMAVGAAALGTYIFWDKISAAGSTVASAFSSGRETIYDGRVGDWKVTYVEGRGENHMTAEKGKTIVKYTDRDPTVGIEWDAKEPKSLADKVEIIVYNDQRVNETFDRSQIDESKYHSVALNEVFTYGDNHYNAIRQGIREVKRKEKSELLTKVKENLK